MNKLLLIVFTIFFVSNVAISAPSFDGGAPATQTFHEADPTVPTISTSNAQQAKVDEIMKQAHQEQVKKAAKASSGLKIRAAVDGNKTSVNQTIQNNQLQQIQEQLASFIQTNLQFQQATNEKIAVLSNQNEKFQVKQGQLVQLMSMFNQQLASQAGKPGAKPISFNHMNTGPQQNWTERFESQYSMYVIIALLTVILLMVVFKKHPTAIAVNANANIAETDEIDTKDEYDFMGSSEAIPAKLDLAHAYIAMEDFSSARKVLRQVISSGDAKQQNEANDMLDRITGK